MKVFLVARSFENQGGIVNYCRMLIGNLPDGFVVNHHISGANYSCKGSLLRACQSIWRVFSSLPAILRAKPDVIHINTSLGVVPLLRDLGYVVVTAMVGRIAKTVIFIHGWDRKVFVKISKSPVLRYCFVLGLSKSGAVIVLCQSYSKSLKSLGVPPEKIRVVHTMYERRLISDEQVNEARSGIKGGGKKDVSAALLTALFMGRLVWAKGLRELLRVAEILKDSGESRIKIVVAGDGPDKEEFIKELGDKGLEDFFVLPGYLTGQKKTEALLAADVFIFPTSYPEGCPIVVVEAMAAGLPILSTDIGAIPELVKNGVSGYILTADDMQSYVEAICNLLSDRELLRKMSRANQEYARQYLEASPASMKIAGIYRTVAGSGRSVTIG